MLTRFRRKGDNPNNELRITHDEIEQLSGFGHNTVVKAMRELKKAGFLKVKYQGGMYKKQSVYIVNGKYTRSGKAEVRWQSLLVILY